MAPYIPMSRMKDENSSHSISPSPFTSICRGARSCANFNCKPQMARCKRHSDSLERTARTDWRPAAHRSSRAELSLMMR